jgi:hypothetical protein
MKNHIGQVIRDDMDIYYNNDDDDWSVLDLILIKFDKVKTDRIVCGGNEFWHKIEKRHLKIFTFKTCAGYTLV